jgi:hypothetical protein
MRKKEFVKAWKQLDGATEALDRLIENGHSIKEYDYIFSLLCSLKQEVEEEIDKRTKVKQG